MDLNETTIIASPCYLGVLGTCETLTPSVLQDQLIHPILSELGRCPERIILPAEGYSSIFLQDWAEKTRIEVQSYECDWRRHGRRAKIFRDSRIEKESTHFLIFLSKKSIAYEKLALKLARKGATVFTIPFGTFNIEQLVLEKPPPKLLTTCRESPLSSYLQIQPKKKTPPSSLPHPQTPA